MSVRRNISVLAAVLTSLCVSAQLPVKQIKTERLPDMNIARAGHNMCYVGDELTVFGGHTDGFVPTATAEYLKDGQWHVLPMTYSHDFGLSTMLRSGNVLLAGGCEQPTGIGHTYTAELYDPQTHTCRGFGNMQQKRVWASALELDSGQVIIVGNWYETDGIELFHEEKSVSGDFKGKHSFAYIKDVVAERSTPYIFRMAEHDALIIGSIGHQGDTLCCTFADRLGGDTIHVPLFKTWQPLLISMHHDEASMIGDEAKGDFTYLLPVQDSTGQVAIAKGENGVFSLLSTARAIPMQCQGERIEYFSNVIVDRQARQAYLVGISSRYHTDPDKARLYVLSIGYDQASEDGGAPMTLYYTDPLYVTPSCAPLLTPDGNLLIAGGLTGNSNYTPSAAVWLLRVGSEPASASGGFSLWFLFLMLLPIVIVVTIFVLALWRKRQKLLCERQKHLCKEEAFDSPISTDSELMARISQLMEEQKLYLNSELKLSDIAKALNTNRYYVSDCINSHGNGSFTQFVNAYRIAYAQNLMRQQPDMKISEVWTASGFSTERTFLRTFKTISGMTPSEWKAQKSTDKK